jgi:uncharacterized OB-fold protein
VSSIDPILAPPVPVPDVVTSGYWDAASGGVFALSRCAECRRWDHPPQERCRYCGGIVAFEPVSGRGTIFSFIINRRQFVPGHPPGEVIALVELEEQPGLRLTGLLDADPEAVAIGLPVLARLALIGDTAMAAPGFEIVSTMGRTIHSESDIHRADESERS